MKQVLFAIAFFLFLGYINTQSPCASAANRQFDFWIGQWEVFHSKEDTLIGYNHIKLLLNDCVLEENWTSRNGGFIK